MTVRTVALVTKVTESLLGAFAQGPAAGQRPAHRCEVQTVYG